MVKITDRESLKEWLEGRPVEDVRMIAARAALRAVPMLFYFVDSPAIAEPNLQRPVLHAFRCGLSALMPTGPDDLQAQSTIRTVPDEGDTQFRAKAALRAMGLAAEITAGDQSMLWDVLRLSMFAVGFAGVEMPRTDKLDEEKRRASMYTAREVATSDAELQRVMAKDFESSDLSALMLQPLWNGEVPESIRTHWAWFRAVLADFSEDGWDYWIDWYDNVLRGDDRDADLEAKIATIPNEIWEQGPKVLNAEIARLTNEHRSRPFAEADFRHRPESNALELVPFEEDVASLDSASARRRLDDGLADLKEACAELARDIQLDKAQVPGTLRRDLMRYAREAEKGAEDVRPGTLNRLGNTLVRWGRTEDIRFGLDEEKLAPKLDDITKSHLALMVAFPGLKARMAPLADAHLDATPEEADTTIGAAIDAIESDAWRDLPSVPEEFPEMVAQQREALREMASRIDLQEEGEARARAIRAVEEGYITLGATVMRLIVRGVEAANTAIKRPDVAVTLALLGAAGSIASLISVIG